MHLYINTRNCIDFITFMQDYPGVDYHHQHQVPHQTDGDGAGGARWWEDDKKVQTSA